MDTAKLFKVFSFLCVLIVIVRSQEGCLQENCIATNGVECNGVGTCNCGTCVCQPSFSGPTCEECPTCRDPCEVFSGCVSCKIYNTGLMGFFECLDLCGYLAHYNEVNKEEYAVLGQDEGFDECERINDQDCRESFKIGGMNLGLRDLFVLTPMDCTERNRQVIEAVYPDILPETISPDILPETTSKTTKKTTTLTITTKVLPKSTEAVTEPPEKVDKSESDIKDISADNSVKTTKVTVKPFKNANSDNINMHKNDVEEPTESYDGGPEKAGAVSGNADVSDESKNGGIRVGYKLTLAVMSCFFVILS